jgi:mycothiol synthase
MLPEENEMNITHRPYAGIRDFILMTSILAIGRKTDSQAHYAHIGDLSWWMFYNDLDDSHWPKHICLWEQEDHTVGWTLLDLNWRSFDLFLLPRLRGSAEEALMLDWSVAQLTDLIRLQGGSEIQTMWIAEHDATRIQQLEQRGFCRGTYAMWYLERSLRTPIAEPQLPEGFTVRPIAGETEFKVRALASHDAFGSQKPFEEYWPRYQRFVHSPVYGPSLDLATLTPDQRMASFCIAWPDPVNHIGLFEPVGTHPDFRNLGLGKAVMIEGLRRLQNYGMTAAMVCVECDNQAAQELYQAVGFEKKYQLRTYVKSI